MFSIIAKLLTDKQFYDLFGLMWFNIICHDIDILDDHLKMYHILLSIYSAYTTKPPVQTLSLKMVFELL